MGTILLHNVALAKERTDILIKGNRIERVAGGLYGNVKVDREIDCTGKTALPGLINMHTHSAMTLMRGVEEDIPLQPWLQKIWAIEANLDYESIYWGTRLAILEMIKTGTTSFLDMYWIIPAIERAVEDSGVRANLSYVLLDCFDPSKAENQRKECLQTYEQSLSWNPRVKMSVAIHSDYTVCEESMLFASALSRDKDILLHTHIAETRSEMEDDYRKLGVSPVKHFHNLGILDRNVVAAHMVWINEEDIELFGKSGCTAVHNINSNLKLSSGYKFRAKELLDAGANVCVGTDGASSSNNLDLRETLKTVAMMQKAFRNDPAACPLEQLMDFATVNGARAMGIDAGVIKEGALADILLINTDNEMFTPNFNFLSNFIFSANSSCVDTVICDGNILMEGRKVKDEQLIVEKANEQAWKLLKKANY